MGGLFGGSKQSSSSQSANRAYDGLVKEFWPMTRHADNGANAFAALLGGDTSGFDTFKKSTGFDAAAEMGSRGITGNAAAGGMLRSGGTAKALQAFGNTLQNQYANNYMDRLLGQANLGFQAGNLVSGAGTVTNSTSTSKGKNGIGGLLGGIASGIAASDRRLKKNVFEVGELPNGLKLYQYRYTDDTGPFVGVMAQDVEKIMPEALGPTVDGYMTVNYDRIKEGVSD